MNLYHLTFSKMFTLSIFFHHVYKYDYNKKDTEVKDVGPLLQLLIIISV